MNGFKHVDYTVDTKDTNQSIFKLLKILRPDWRQDKIKLQVLTGGYVNLLYKCYTESDTRCEEAIVIRINMDTSVQYGADREKEIRNLLTLNQRNVGVPLIASFNNGLVMKCLNGERLDREEVSIQKDPLKLVAKEFARLHTASSDEDLNVEYSKDPMQMVKGTFDRMPLSFQNPDHNKRYHDNLPPDEIKREFQMVMKLLNEPKSRKTICHNDAHGGNILYDDKNGQVHFVDWEQSGYNYAVFDLAYFTSMTAGHPARGHLVMSSEFKKIFLRAYLEEIATLNGNLTVAEKQLDDSFVELCKFELLCILFLTIMLLICNENKNTGYDYMSYVEYLWDYYKRTKQKYKSFIPEIN